MTPAASVTCSHPGCEWTATIRRSKRTTPSKLHVRGVALRYAEHLRFEHEDHETARRIEQAARTRLR